MALAEEIGGSINDEAECLCCFGWLCPLLGRENLDKLHHVSEPQFPHLSIGGFTTWGLLFVGHQNVFGYRAQTKHPMGQSHR
ncbi:hypothetical protein LEMLEM_LOCUS6874 [Lemmus lemmus]